MLGLFAIYYYMMFFSYHVVTYNGIKMTDRWFSPGTPASSTTKTGRHDIDEILLKVASKHQKSYKIY
jgi:hypothetical protein